METPQDQNPNPAANQPLNPDLMGYPSVEALVNAKRASDQEAQRMNARLQTLESQLQHVYQPPANPRQDVKERSRPSDRLSEFGVPVDALTEFLDERLQTAFAPITAGLTARQSILAEYPDYNKFESDVAAFINSDPRISQTYQRMFQADPAGAFEYAFLKFGESRRRSVDPGADVSAEVAAHAAIPGGRNGEARRPETQGPAASVSQAWRRYQETGSPAAARDYAKARLSSVISDDFLNQ